MNDQNELVAENLKILFNRTLAFHNTALKHIAEFTPFSSTRSKVAFDAGQVAIEHASSALLLNSQGFNTSALTLMRPQYESMLRGLWLLHAAEESWITKLAQPLTTENAQRANTIPMLVDMLDALEKSQTSPKQIVAQLQEYKNLTWKPLSSFTHGGFHPISRAQSGYPLKQVFDMQRNSNGIFLLTMQLLTVLTGFPDAMHPVRAIHEEYKDCFTNA